MWVDIDSTSATRRTGDHSEGSLDCRHRQRDASLLVSSERGKSPFARQVRVECITFSAWLAWALHYRDRTIALTRAAPENQVVSPFIRLQLVLKLCSSFTSTSTSTSSNRQSHSVNAQPRHPSGYLSLTGLPDHHLPPSTYNYFFKSS